MLRKKVVTFSQIIYKKLLTCAIVSATMYLKIRIVLIRKEYEMLYEEFIAGTGCKDNAHNLKVYKDLEIMYMNSDMSKAEIYEYGKKLVDNSKSEKQLELEAQVNAEIASFKELIARRKDDIKRYERYLECTNTKEEIRWIKDSIKAYKENIRHYRNRIAALKWVLA